MSGLCVVCHAQPGPVCPDDQQAIDQQLADLPTRYAAVAATASAGKSATSERVATSSHVTAKPPAPVDWLSMVGPGSDVLAVLHPLMRHWSIKRKVLVTTHVVGHARTVEVEVTDWFHELVLGDDGKPVMVPDDDQVGVVPPREWADIQVRQWRAHFGHHVPARTLLPPQRPYIPATFLTMLRTTAGVRAVAFLAAVYTARGAHTRMAFRGLFGPLSRDPDVDQIERRGKPPRTLQWDVTYLRTWLDEACAEDALDIAAFAAQLRALHAEIGRILGDTPDQEWIGRCPAFIAELGPDGEPTWRKRPCGGGLWQDNNAFTAQVRCPRCRITWDTRGHAGAGTAREIRRVWPIDRRRRYDAAEIDRLNTPKCPSCGRRVKIEWRDVTGTRDNRRTWQPISASCANGCDEARRTL